MRILKKINKGAVLTILVLTALVIYLIGVENERKEDKEKINKVCNEIIEMTDECMVYPEEIQKLGEEISKEEKEKNEKRIKEKLSEKMIENKEAIEIQQKMLISNLNYQNSKNEMITKFERKMGKISEYQFEGDQVTVRFTSTVDIESKYIDTSTGEEKIRKNKFNTYEDEIILQKVDDNWKMVYSNLQYGEYGFSNSDSLVMY